MTANMDLFSYLDGQASSLRTNLQIVARLIAESLPLFDLQNPAPPSFQVPYSTDVPRIEAADKLSLSTNLMVAHALQAFVPTRAHKGQLLLPRDYNTLESDPSTTNLSWLADSALLATKTAALEEITKSGKIVSTTFGDDSPLTACWLAELLLAEPDTTQTKYKTLLEHIFATHELANPNAVRKPDDAGVDHERGFCRLRYFQAYLLLTTEGTTLASDTRKHSVVSEYAYRFLSALHDQLSFYRIPDSRFDPAELAFNLEGAVLASSQGAPHIERGVIRAALDVIVACQSNTSHWRPTRPFAFKGNGSVYLPVSVEVANSITRTLSLIAHLPDKLSLASQSDLIDSLSRYLHWLEGRTVPLSDGSGKNVKGWHSDHVNNPRVVHPWETSQVLLFLVNLRATTERFLGNQSLRIAGIKIERSTEKWDSQQKVRRLGPEYDAPSRIKQLFISPATKEDAPRSMLLYGPPGTGKTFTAKCLAGELGLDLVSLSVSDFLAEGPAVERRAKALFDVLSQQRRCVVLFDEIDHLLLDRSSDIYHKMDTVFQFVTPGMLTKLQDLRQSGHVLFIIATNYEHRIDPAIKRAGRIDHCILVLPPDLEYRLQFIRKRFPKLNADELKSCASASLFLTYGDLKKICSQPLSSAAELARAFEKAARAASLASYRRIVRQRPETGHSIYTIREVVGMLGLWLECPTFPATSSPHVELTRLLGNKVAKFLGTPEVATELETWTPDMKATARDMLRSLL